VNVSNYNKYFMRVRAYFAQLTMLSVVIDSTLQIPKTDQIEKEIVILITEI